MARTFLPVSSGNLRFQCLLFAAAQFAGAGNLGFRKSQACVQFLFELFNDPRQEWKPPVIDEHRNQIADLPLNPISLHDYVEQLALLLRWN